MLYDLHDNPGSLIYHDKLKTHHPGVVYSNLRDSLRKDYLRSPMANITPYAAIIPYSYDQRKIDNYLGDQARRDSIEKVLAKNSTFALRYALEVLGGPFPLGEPAIFKAKDLRLGVNYAVHVLQSPVESLEVDLVNRAYQEDADTLRDYLHSIRDIRWKIRWEESLPIDARGIEDCRPRINPWTTLPGFLTPVRNYLKVFEHRVDNMIDLLNEKESP